MPRMRFLWALALLLILAAVVGIFVTGKGNEISVELDANDPGLKAGAESVVPAASNRHGELVSRREDQRVAQESDLAVRVTGHLRWSLGRPVADRRYSFRPIADRDPFALMAVFRDNTSLPRTSDQGEWSADTAELSGARLWFEIGPGLFASFVVQGNAREDVVLEVEKCSIRASVMGLGVEECSFATQPRTQHPETKSWSYEDYLYIEPASNSAFPALYLVTQFLEGRKGDGDVFIPAVRGVNYAVSCGSKSKRAVKAEVFVNAPGDCQFTFKPRARNLRVEIVDGRGNRLAGVSGYQGFAEPKGASDSFQPFDGGSFRPVERSVLHQSSGSELSLIVVLSDGEFFSRRIPEKDWAQGLIQFVKGTGSPAEVFKLPLEEAPNKGKVVTNTDVWTYSRGKHIQGIAVRNWPAFPQTPERFYCLIQGQSMLVMGLKVEWSEIWFQLATGDLASVRVGGDSFRWMPTYELKDFDWASTKQYSGGRHFSVRVDHRLSAHSGWRPIRSWDLTKTPTPTIHLLKGLPYRIVVTHGNRSLQTVLQQG